MYHVQLNVHWKRRDCLNDVFNELSQLYGNQNLNNHPLSGYELVRFGIRKGWMSGQGERVNVDILFKHQINDMIYRTTIMLLKINIYLFYLVWEIE